MKKTIILLTILAVSIGVLWKTKHPDKLLSDVKPTDTSTPVPAVVGQPTDRHRGEAVNPPFLSPEPVATESQPAAPHSLASPGRPRVIGTLPMLTLKEGDDAVLEVEVGGPEPLYGAWHWRAHPTPTFKALEDWRQVTNAQRVFRRFTPVRASDAGEYCLVVTNRIGFDQSTIATVTVTALPSPNLTLVSNAFNAVAYSSIRISSNNRGGELAGGQWEYRKEADTKWAVLVPSTRLEILLKDLDPKHAGRIRLRGWNVSGTNVSPEAQVVVVDSKPRIFVVRGDAENRNQGRLKLREGSELQRRETDLETFSGRVWPKLAGSIGSMLDQGSADTKAGPSDFTIRWQFLQHELKPIFSSGIVRVVIGGKLQKKPKLKFDARLQWTITIGDRQVGVGEEVFTKEMDPNKRIGVIEKNADSWVQDALNQLDSYVNNLREEGWTQMLDGMAVNVSQKLTQHLAKLKSQQTPREWPVVEN